MSYFDHNPEWKAERDRLDALLSAAHNACHDWLRAHPGETKAPEDLARALEEAAADLQKHRAAESARYFHDIRYGGQK